MIHVGCIRRQSRITLEEAIKKYSSDTENQQLVQWLTELKDLREVNRVLINECDRLIKEKGELLKKVTESPQIAIYKQLLKSATVIIKNVDCNDDYLCDECEYRAKCDGSFSFYWKRLNEASKLIGGDTE